MIWSAVVLLLVPAADRNLAPGRHCTDSGYLSAARGMSRAVSTHPAPAGRPGTASSEYAPGAIELARRVVAVLGGRYSTELGIDVDAGEAEVERWFVAAALFGARIPARVAEQTFGVLAAAGLARIGQMRHVPSGDLIAMLEAGTPATTSAPPPGCWSSPRSSTNGTTARSR